MALTTGFQLPFGIQPLNAVPVDSWSGPYEASTEALAKTAANSSIPSGVRFKSMEVRLIINGDTKKYWYRDGITDNDLIEFTSTPVTTNTSNLTLNLSDASSIKRLDTSLGNITVTVPSNLSVPFNIGTQLVLANVSTNIVEIVATSGVTIISKNNKFKLSSQGSVASLFKTLTNEWLIVGDLTA